ncbi:hypothetical protein FXO38_02290 [Capsicum annuum]|nr:hypothetical protein FXO38_02290 [Capsicum annuum]
MEHSSQEDVLQCVSLHTAFSGLVVRILGHMIVTVSGIMTFAFAQACHQALVTCKADGSTVDASQEAIHYITDQAILGSLCIQHGRTCCRCVSLPPVIRLVSYWSALHMNSSL